MAQKQLNVCMPKEWFDQLEELAYGSSNHNFRARSPLAVIRDAVKANYLRWFTANSPRLTPDCPSANH